MRSGTIRTCLGCGGKAAPAELVRLKVDGMSVVVDRARSGGRGAWLHPAAPCLEKALKRRALGRALRAESAVVDAALLRVELTGNPRKD